MSLKRRIFEAVSNAMIAILGLNRPVRVYRAFLSRINAVKQVEINGTCMLFDANEELHLLRAEWLATKEPETLEWIDGFAPGEVFFDIGANIGVFSVYAALHRGCEVYAFEPEAKNYACLNRNILLNRADDRIHAVNLGFHDRTGIEVLNLHDVASGAALHSLGSARDWRGAAFTPKFRQAVLAFELDRFIELFGVPVPNYVKLDVDGNEAKIVRGGLRTLADPRVRSLMVELKEGDAELIGLIESCGLRLRTRTRAAMQGEYQDTYNALFTRAS